MPANGRSAIRSASSRRPVSRTSWRSTSIASSICSTAATSRSCADPVVRQECRHVALRIRLPARNRGLGPGAHRGACAAGDTTLYGTGSSPGFITAAEPIAVLGARWSRARSRPCARRWRATATARSCCSSGPTGTARSRSPVAGTCVTLVAHPRRRRRPVGRQHHQSGAAGSLGRRDALPRSEFGRVGLRRARALPQR